MSIMLGWALGFGNRAAHTRRLPGGFTLAPPTGSAELDQKISLRLPQKSNPVRFSRTVPLEPAYTEFIRNKIAAAQVPAGGPPPTPASDPADLIWEATSGGSISFDTLTGIAL